MADEGDAGAGCGQRQGRGGDPLLQGEQCGRQVASDAVREIDPGWEARVDLDQVQGAGVIAQQFQFQRSIPFERVHQPLADRQQFMIVDRHR